MFNNLFFKDIGEIMCLTDINFKELSNKKIFATGCSGFFGIWIIESFLYVNKELKLNAKLTILTRNKELFLSTHPHLSEYSEIDYIEGDICSFKYPNDKYDFVIHGAAQASAFLIMNSPHEIIKTIVEGTKHLLEFTKKCDAKKLLFISSGAAYGKQHHSFSYMSEDSIFAPSTLDPLSAYGEAKRLAELLCVLSTKNSPLDVKIARCFTFVGPYLPLNQHFAIGNFIHDALLGKDIIVNSDGTSLRSYLYASELAAWLWAILIDGKNCEIYNVGSDQVISIGELAKFIGEISNMNCKFLIAEKQKMIKQNDSYVPSIHKVRNDLGLKQLVSLEIGIKKTFDWYKKQNLY